MNILAIGAHPDDIELGCGGSLAMHMRNKDSIRTLILTKGEKGGPIDIRTKESIQALTELGIEDIIFGSFDDTKLFNTIPDLVQFIEKHVNEFKPDRVYTNTQNDRHQDHIATFIATKAACRKVDQVLAYETPSSDYNFKPQAFIDIENFLEIKIGAIKKYTSQNTKNYMKIESIKGLSRFRGQQFLNYNPVEAFEIIKYKILDSK